jgi:hypothetical protein
VAIYLEKIMNLKKFLFVSMIGLTMTTGVFAQSALEKLGAGLEVLKKVLETAQPAASGEAASETSAQNAAQGSADVAPGGVDVSKFDIAGVKLGMTYEEAKKAVAKHYGVSVSEVRDSDAVRNVSHPLTGAEYSRSAFWLAKNNTTLWVHFIFRLPEDKTRPTTVESVKYEVPRNREAELKETAIKKYGQPNSVHAYSGHARWCEVPGKSNSGTCASGNSMALTGVTLELTNHVGLEALKKFVAEVEENKTKVSF